MPSFLALKIEPVFRHSGKAGEPHIDDEWRLLASQSEALAHIARLVDDEKWRSDKRRSWSAVLRRLVRHMDWDTGLISGLTSQHLAAAGNRATRTVSRVLTWARDQGLLVVVEPGASAEFLGTEAGRAPTYALVTHQPAPGVATEYARKGARPDIAPGRSWFEVPPAGAARVWVASADVVDGDRHYRVSLRGQSRR